MPLPLDNERYTYADYLKWNDDERFELINGKAVMMASPTFTHQTILGQIYRHLAEFLDDKPCNVVMAPFDVRLFEKKGERPEDVDTVVQPDILVICDHKKIDEHGCKGAPDMVIEILSPSTQGHDCFVKLNLYQQAGVREYWIVDPESKTVKVLILDDEGIYHISKAYKQTDTVKVNILNGCVIELDKAFSEI